MVNAEILPPESKNLVQMWRWQVRPTIARIIKIGVAIPALAWAAWLLQNFLQLRGVVNLTASRIDLGLLTLCILLVAYVATVGSPQNVRWRIVLFPFIVLAALAVDWFTPKPPTQSVSTPLPRPTQAATATKTPTAEDTQKVPLLPYKKAAVPKSDSEPPIEIVQHPYDLSGDRRKKFLSLLKPGDDENEVLQFGCMASSESSCVAAGNFLILFSEAGWKLDENRVVRAEPQIPKDGVSFVTHADKEPPIQPPHLGTWQQMSASQMKIGKAFLEMGIPLRGSTQLTMPAGTLGIYFGPEPKPQTVELQLFLSDCTPTTERCDILPDSTETHGSFLASGNAHQLVHAKRPTRVVFQPDGSSRQFSVDESELPKKLTLGRCGGKACRLIIRRFVTDGIMLDSGGAIVRGDDGKSRGIMVKWTATAWPKDIKLMKPQ